MPLQNSSGFKVYITTSTTAPACASESIGYMWYETDTNLVKTITDTPTGLAIKIVG